jgi:hypothetical protein
VDSWKAEEIGEKERKEGEKKGIVRAGRENT